MVRRRNKSRISEFVALPWKVLNSLAYIELPYASAKALPYFRGKPKLPYTDPDYHRVTLDFTYNEAKRLGFSSGTFYGVIKNLIHYGFVDPVERGGKRGCGYSNSKFKLSERWSDFGKPSFRQVEWVQTPFKLAHPPMPKSGTCSVKIRKKVPPTMQDCSDFDAVGADLP